MNKGLLRKFIGTKEFYKMVLVVAVPIMIQNGITNFVSLLDNLMVGRVGMEEMSGVSIVNQLIMVFNLCIFGGISGAGIFTSQFFGLKDDEGICNTVRFKFIITAALTIIAMFIFIMFDDELITMYLNSGDGKDMSAASLDETLKHAKDYLRIILIGLPAFMIQQVYSSTMRETGQTVVPMVAGVIAVVTNLIINALLIYGIGFFPKLGVVGAAVGTSVSRYVEAVIVITWTYAHKTQMPFVKGALNIFKLPGRLGWKIFLTGLPLLINEGMWSAGNAAMLKNYSLRGLDAVAGLNIANTIINLFSVVFLALGVSIAIVVGKMLGEGKMSEAKDTATKMIVFSVVCSFMLGLVAFFIAPFFPNLYNATDLAKEIATKLIMIQSVFLPQIAFINAAYFTLRSGGKTVVTFLFDSVFMWLVSVNITMVLCKFTGLDVMKVFLAVQLADIIKTIVGFILVKKGVWIQNIVGNTRREEYVD